MSWVASEASGNGSEVCGHHGDRAYRDMHSQRYRVCWIASKVSGRSPEVCGRPTVEMAETGIVFLSGGIELKRFRFLS